MNDEAELHSDALAELILFAENPGDVCGSLNICGDVTPWDTTHLDEECKITGDANPVSAKARVQSFPFPGFLVHRELVERTGYPDAGYFIAVDDIECCLRPLGSAITIRVTASSPHENTTGCNCSLKPFLAHSYDCLLHWLTSQQIVTGPGFLHRND